MIGLRPIQNGLKLELIDPALIWALAQVLTSNKG
jgi:hypothetical protein